ncbi:MAG TPA: glycosyltransferase family 2 protein [Chitinophagaceae bacterium]|jgi:glycosyltransferase involved in cell wall biosynthesis|nr:glycosyltransferase family 2 protein [Chitinophagaceae bacterium]OPZ18434.1 MAG: Undecaprenyl-phosphate 4-deoxy-4-formamido-L-arabinose transferase [Bacteroidetes bacterium ADurb.BinA245]HMW66893.1 glycosyltransferase family 2 protein [Chitinophagaceae bacterium]HMX77740.1 glycosyltransferase family 2 protein [Chitinophagaceae bacterium]HNA18968.1 glycosyltransferase family 2 protein [Chitinophagaceae bacterium]
MDISIIIPLLDEAESLPELSSWIEKVMQENKFSYEVIFVDDGSEDNSWNVIEQLRSQNENIKGIKFQRNYGKSAALNEAFREAQGDVVITMDADLQDSPDEIPELYKMVMTDGFDIVSGWKKKRYDNTFTKNIPSKFFNAVTRKVSGIKLHDFNCGLKAYKNKVVKSIEVYGEMHRYIPVLAKWSGFKKIGEKVVAHRARKFGKSKFGMRRFVNGFLDLLSISFVGKFSKRPMHFFGLWGSLFFLIGLGISVYLIVSKIIDSSFPITNRPGFYLALTSIVIGMQLFLAGFIGELISRNSPSRNSYLIEKKTGL